MSTFDVRRTLDEAQPFVESLREVVPGELHGVIAGSYRRAMSGENVRIGDLDLMVTSDDQYTVDLRDYEWPEGFKVTAKRGHGWIGQEGSRMMADVWAVPIDSWGPFAMFLTGPADFNVRMRHATKQVSSDMMLSQYGLFAVDTDEKGRRKPGARLDRPSHGLVMSVAERQFWSEWSFAVFGKETPFPSPMQRDSWQPEWL